MKFIFLKLSSFRFGAARRHCPFTSIIHKPISFLFAFIFFSFHCFLVPVSALAPQIVPQFRPIIDTDIVNFQNSYMQLDPAAQAAAQLLFGAYVTEYAGLADYGYVFDDAPSDASLKERLIFLGDQFVDTLFLPYNMADQLILTPLINLGQGIVNKVKSVTSVDDFYDDILNASDYGLSYTYDIGFSLNQLFVRNGSLYNWQFSEKTIGDYQNVSWNVSRASEVDIANILQYVGDAGVRFNQNNSNVSCIYGTVNSVTIRDFNTLFIDTDDHTVYLYHYLGQPYSINNSLKKFGLFFNNTVYKDTGGFGTYLSPLTVNYTYDSSLTSVSDILNAYFNHVNSITSTVYPIMSDFVKYVYAGIDWAGRYSVSLSDDLGITNTNSLEVLNPIKDAVFDLKALLQQIVNAKPDPNVELPLKPIIYNITQIDGSPLTVEDLQGISFNVTVPESGIVVPSGLFGSSKGFIDYLWYMTKPLVQYTHDFIGTMWFDGVDGFDFSGPAPIVFGVITLGLIGGLIVKFLL